MSLEQSSEDEEGPTIHVTNEFASAVVKKVRSRNGELLRLSSARWGTHIDLDPVELECITWQSHELFTALLAETPIPTDDLEDHRNGSDGCDPGTDNSPVTGG